MYSHIDYYVFNLKMKFIVIIYINKFLNKTHAVILKILKDKLHPIP